MINGAARRIPSLEVHADRFNTGTINWMLEGVGVKSPVAKPVDQEMIDGQVQWAGNSKELRDDLGLRRQVLWL